MSSRLGAKHADPTAIPPEERTGNSAQETLKPLRPPVAVCRGPGIPASPWLSVGHCGHRAILIALPGDRDSGPRPARVLIGTPRARWTPSCLRSEVTSALTQPGHLPVDGGSVPA